MASIRKEILINAPSTHVWSAVRCRLSHHNASLQVFTDGADRSRAVWTADLLPNGMVGAIAAMIDQGAAIMKQTLERSANAG